MIHPAPSFPTAPCSPLDPTTIPTAPYSPLDPTTIPTAPCSPLDPTTIPTSPYSPLDPTTIPTAPCGPIDPTTIPTAAFSFSSFPSVITSASLAPSWSIHYTTSIQPLKFKVTLYSCRQLHSTLSTPYSSFQSYPLHSSIQLHPANSALSSSLRRHLAPSTFI
jgi:hypothetical protein